MIEKIELENVATYHEKQVLSGLKEINFIYGSNGSGKTTISRVLKSPEQYNDCQLTWKDDSPVEVLVYNTDFVKDHFTERTNLKGVFTLGAENSEILKQIDDQTESIAQFREKIKANEITLNGENANTGKMGNLETSKMNILKNFGIL